MTAPSVPALACICAVLCGSVATRLWTEEPLWRQLAEAVVPPAHANLPEQEHADEDNDAFLEALRRREAELEEKDRLLDIRESDIAQANRRLETEIARLEATERALRETLAVADGAAEADVARLVSVYESMRPATAAPLFEAMAPEFAAGFLMRMDPEVAGAILSQLPADIAYALSAVMAGRHGAVATR